MKWPPREVPLSKRNLLAEVAVDVVNFALGVFLFLSPWLLDFTSALATGTSWMAGATIAIVAAFSIADVFETVSVPAVFEQEEWINLVVGLWVMVCSWILGFQGDAGARNVHLVVGLVIAIIAAVELWLLRRTPRPNV